MDWKKIDAFSEGQAIWTFCIDYKFLGEPAFRGLERRSSRVSLDY